MHKTTVLSMLLLILLFSGCSSAQSLQDRYDEGHRDGYEECHDEMMRNLTADDLDATLTREIAQDWIKENESEFIQIYSPYFLETIGVEQYNQGYQEGYLAALDEHGDYADGYSDALQAYGIVE